MTSINLPKTVTSIDEYAFYKCTALTSIVVPGSLINLGSHVFEECDALTTATIEEGVKNIWYWTFAHCENLTNIYLPSTLSAIYQGAFYGMNNNGYNVYIKSTTPPTIDSEVFRNHSHNIGTLKIYVPTSTLQTKYKSSWSEYSSYIYVG